MVGIQIGKEQEERKREEEGLNFETTPWWNFRNHHGLCGRRAAEREFVKFVKLRAQPTAKAKAMYHVKRAMHAMRGPMHYLNDALTQGRGSMYHGL